VATVAAGFSSAASASGASKLNEKASPPENWWIQLNDPVLNDLEARALKGNLNLQAAVARIAESRAQVRKAGAQDLPSLNATGGFARIDSPNLGLGGGQNSGLVESIWTAGFDASWEIDVFGGQRRQIEAAKAGYEAQVEDRRKAMISVTAEVAQHYMQLRGLQDRQRIAGENLALEKDTLRLTRSLHKAGFSDDLQVREAETSVAQTHASRVPLNVAIVEEEHALAVLLGLSPADLAGEFGRAKVMLALPSSVAIGVPADLLRRRPDIREAERRVAAANAEVGAAIAGYYPKFSLTGLLATDAPRFQGLFDLDNRVALIYPNVSWGFLDFGRTRSQVETERARFEEATLAYKSIVLEALREVEDALSAYLNEEEHLRRLQSAESASRSAVALSRDQYRQGIVDLLHVLDAQRQLLQLEDGVAQSNQAMATDFVALQKALGSGPEESN
jgi:NodT family efflux transporter outer membrane factor (OMF) lipoprotein